ncbi:MAG: CapA family protein [Oscillospiraceae bacterium]|nr:CapA family protein [Oscillospiraceae bacterium]
MAFDPEQMKRRRQQRAQQRAKQAAQRRRTLTGVLAAVVILCVCLGLIFLRGRGPQEHPEQTTNSMQDSTQKQESSTTIHFVAGGDLNVTDGVVASGGSDYDYTGVFMDIAHLLADGDLTALNFEGNLCGAPYGAASAPIALAQALDRAGVDLLQLANSCSINRGLSGLKDTINGVRVAGMEPLGVYATREEAGKGKGYTICNVRGIKIGVVSFTKGMDGLTLPADGTGCVNVLYKDYDSVYQEVDTEGITSVLDALNKEKPDVTVALLHWGSEYNDTISSSQKQIVSLLQSKGVDAIVGTHSHYVQKMEYNPDTGAFVAYSLGDFYGDVPRAGTEYSVLLDLEITKDHTTGQTKITGYDYTPIFTVTQDGLPQRVVRIREAMAAWEAGHINAVSKETYNAMAYALTRIEARVAGK